MPRAGVEDLMRVGRNPTKLIAGAPVSVEAPPPVSVGLLTHVPFVAGYHSEQLDVVKLAVLSARAHAGRPIYLVVVDNGSCEELRDWLVTALAGGIIDQLVLNARNLGKVTAVSQIILGSPGPDVVYSDGDLRFLPGWLEPMLRIAAGIPDVGVVGGTPVLPASHGVAHPESYAAPPPTRLPHGVEVERGAFLTDAYLREFLLDTGCPTDEVAERIELLRGTEDVRYRCGDVRALAGAGHAQFLVTSAARDRLHPHVGTQALNSRETHDYDRVLDRTGLLRVSVEEPVFRHLGNRLRDEDRAELTALSGMEAGRRRSRRPSAGFWDRTVVRKVAWKVHDFSFRVLYETDRDGSRSSE